MGLSLDVKKTECMVISKKSSNPNLVRKGEEMKHVSKFKYLGYLITSDGRCTNKVPDDDDDDDDDVDDDDDDDDELFRMNCA
ncbi:hypothetical protein PoB_001230200 [Plakobranchus ocellatus]|uniref:Uncharacterized protein n=1 Tax=Plakobranchus ocellatus TaxID=259542 RepID=A0AAV3YTJ8_9GAST|nr:hypothetical protein PoB_001230200 [Plakobranchus ocellatus]